MKSANLLFICTPQMTVVPTLPATDTDGKISIADIVKLCTMSKPATIKGRPALLKLAKELAIMDGFDKGILERQLDTMYGIATDKVTLAMAALMLIEYSTPCRHYLINHLIQLMKPSAATEETKAKAQSPPEMTSVENLKGRILPFNQPGQSTSAPPEMASTENYAIGIPIALQPDNTSSSAPEMATNQILALGIPRATESSNPSSLAPEMAIANNVIGRIRPINQVGESTITPSYIDSSDIKKISSQSDTEETKGDNLSVPEMATNQILALGIPRATEEDELLIPSVNDDAEYHVSMGKLEKMVINDKSIHYSPSTDMMYVPDLISASMICDKTFSHWNSNSRTKSFITSAAKQLGKQESELIIKGKGKTKGGTWVHSLLAIDIAMWLSPDYAVKVCSFIMRYTRGDVTLAHDVLAHADKVNGTSTNLLSIAPAPGTNQIRQTAITSVATSTISAETTAELAKLNEALRVANERLASATGPRPLDLESAPMAPRLITYEQNGLRLYQPGLSCDGKYELALRSMESWPTGAMPKNTDDLIRIMYDWIVMLENTIIKSDSRPSALEAKCPPPDDLAGSDASKMATRLLGRINKLCTLFKLRPLIEKLSPDSLAKSIATIVDNFVRAADTGGIDYPLKNVLIDTVKSYYKKVQSISDIGNSITKLLDTENLSDADSIAISKVWPKCLVRPYHKSIEFATMVATITDISAILSASVPLDAEQSPLSLSIFSGVDGKLPYDETPLYYRILMKPEIAAHESDVKDASDCLAIIQEATEDAITVATAPRAQVADIINAIEKVVDIAVATTKSASSYNPPEPSEKKTKPAKGAKASASAPPIDRRTAIEQIANFPLDLRRAINNHLFTVTSIPPTGIKIDLHTINIYVGHYGYAPYILPRVIDAVPRVYIHLIAGHLTDPGAFHLYPGGRFTLADSLIDIAALQAISASQEISIGMRDMINTPGQWLGLIADMNHRSDSPHHFDTIASCVSAIGQDNVICVTLPMNKDMVDWRIWSPAELIRHHANRSAIVPLSR